MLERNSDLQIVPNFTVILLFSFFQEKDKEKEKNIWGYFTYAYNLGC